jgi:hypothetical protein
VAPPHLRQREELDDAAEAAREAISEAEHALRAAAARSRQVARQLSQEGLSGKDIAACRRRLKNDPVSSRRQGVKIRASLTPRAAFSSLPWDQLTRSSLTRERSPHPPSWSWPRSGGPILADPSRRAVHCPAGRAVDIAGTFAMA